MANKFTKEDIETISEAKRLLHTRIFWADDPGGESARSAYMAIDAFLEGPAAKTSSFCPHCGFQLK